MSNKIDVLGREDFIIKLRKIVEMLANKKQGCCFGIDGAWGSGKSFVLEKFENEIRDIMLEETADNKYFVFHYDCWKYDYYEEPAIAIVAAMLDATDKELRWFTDEVENTGKTALAAVKKTLSKIAGEFCKNKIGIDLVEIASEALQENDNDVESKFDLLYGFKRALEEARTGIREIAETKTVVIVVDELDRCLPEYAIKVLERMHHIFVNIENVIVIVSMDKAQLEHSIKEIYGDIEVDKYLRKFISFKINLCYGSTKGFSNKYESYFSMFDNVDKEKDEIEYFLTDIMLGIDMRTQERVFRKAELIHNIICGQKKYDCSIMTFEVLYLTALLVLRTRDIRTLLVAESKSGDNDDFGIFFRKIQKYKRNIPRDSMGIMHIRDRCVEKTLFWLATLYSEYNSGYSLKYYYDKSCTNELSFIQEFLEFVNIVDTD